MPILRQIPATISRGPIDLVTIWRRRHDGSSNINSRQNGRAATNETKFRFSPVFSPADIICRDIVVCRDDMDFRGD
jgi:hypothetical protein